MTQMEYRARRRPHRYFAVIALIFILLIVIGIIAGWLASIKWPWLDGLRPNAVQTVFLLYVALYASIWIFYLISYGRDINVQTLRRFLHDRSEFWNPQEQAMSDKDKEQKLVASFRDKGRVTITTLAIMIASSTLLTTRSFDTSRQIIDDISKGHDISGNYWSLSMIYIGMIFAAAAFVLLLIAIDAIDTSFNEFGEPDNRKVVAYFYRESVFPKYFGLISVIFSFIFYIAAEWPEIASFAIALFLAAGYYYWFPNIYEDATGRRRLRTGLGFILCAIPFAVRVLWS